MFSVIHPSTSVTSYPRRRIRSADTGVFGFTVAGTSLTIQRFKIVINGHGTDALVTDRGRHRSSRNSRPLALLSA